MDLSAEFQITFAEGLQNRTLNTCSRWAAKRRMMGEPFPGPYSWRFHPWVREIHDSRAQYNCAMKAAQLGVTEVLINRALFVLDRKHRDVLYVLPTATVASDFSKARFATALKLSPYLQSIFTDTNSVNLKQAGANTLYIRGSRSDSNLVSIPVSALFLDEVDRMDQSAVWLALERLSGQLHKEIWAISTPTIPNYGIHKLYLDSTQEHYCFPCPSCSRWTELIWPDCIEIIGDSISDPRCHESYLKCKECKAKLEHQAKPQYLSAAIWEPTNLNGNPEKRGFHVSQLYSYTVTPGELVEAYYRGFGDEAANKEFHNSKLGLPFIGDGAKVTDEMLNRCIRKHSIEDPRPQRGGRRTITMGVDQGKWSYVSVCEWFFDHFDHDLNVAALGKLLWYGKFHEDDWHILDELMSEWQVLACVIDADPQINEARRFARRFPGYVYLCRYRRGQTAKEISISDEDSGAPMATVDRTNWLTAALGRFKTDPPRIFLPCDISQEYREHLKAMVRTYETEDDGNAVATFVSTGPDHYAHSFTYAEIALPLAASITTGEDIGKFI
jgi:hypothetical protein